MEAERDTRRELDAGDGVAGDILCGEDDEVGGVPFGVVHEAEEVAVVLGGVIGRGTNTNSPAVAASPKSWTSVVARRRSCLTNALPRVVGVAPGTGCTVAAMPSPITAV